MDRMINSSKYWFLNNVNYSPNKLEIRIIEGIAVDTDMKKEANSRKIKVPSWPVEITENSKIIDIIFRNVLSFECHNKAIPKPDKNEETSFKTFRELSKSEYLDRSGSFNLNRKHYALYTEFNVIDILSESPPLIIQE